MAIFEIEGPDGSIYEIDAPDEQSAVSGFQQMIGGSQPSAAASEFAASASAATQNPARGQYEALPAWQKPIVAASDIAQRTADGAMFGFGDEIAAGIRAPFTGRSYADELADQERRSTGERNRAGAAAPVAEIAGGIRTALSAPSLAGNSLQAGHGLGRVAAGSAVDGAVMGGLVGLGGTGTMDERMDAAGSGATLGLGVGVAAPLAIAGGSKALQRVVSPFVSSPERQRAVGQLAGEGIETTAGQQTGSRGLRYAEGELGGSVAADFMEKQGEQFTRAALKRAGIKADRATPEVIDEAFETIGRRFDKLAASHKLRPDQKLIDDMRAAFDEYGSLVPESQRVPVITNLTNDIVDAFRGGKELSGEVYQSLTSRLGRLARSAKSDPQLSGALHGIREALDDGMERSISQNSKSAAGLWRSVRRQYRNMMVLEDAASRAGENAALGLISPSALRSATKTKHGTRNYARGKGDFADLARAGEAIMKALPDSGTASRLSARNVGALGPSIVGAGAGGAYGAQNEGGMAGALAGALAGFVAPKAIGRAMMSKSGQRYLANQLMRSGMTPEKRELFNRLLNYGGASSGPGISGSIPALSSP